MASVCRTKRASAHRGYALATDDDVRRYGGPVPRGVVVVVTIVAVAAATPSLARADCDPASDILPTESVYFPFEQPSPDLQRALTKAVDAVYAKGDRVKVAVIATRNDLGAIPSLMNKPGDYAMFLGQELAGFYVGPLLIVMPSGWGVYDGGRSVAAEDGVLKRIGVVGSSSDNLVRSATTAVQKLESAGALKSRDIRAPYVYPETVTIHPGKDAVLSFRVLDDSNRASVSVKVVARGKTLATLSSPLAPTDYPDAHSVRWAVPKTIARKGLKVCMRARDAAGNASGAICMPLRVGK